MYASPCHFCNIPFTMALRVPAKQRQNCRLCLDTVADYAILVSIPPDYGKHNQTQPKNKKEKKRESLTCEPITTSEPSLDAAGEVKAVPTSEQQAAINRKDQMTVCDALSNVSAKLHKYSA